MIFFNQLCISSKFLLSIGPNQNVNESHMNYNLNTGDYTETIFEEPSSSESKTWTKEMLEKKYITSPNRPILSFDQKISSFKNRSPENKFSLPIIGAMSSDQKTNTITESHLD